MANYNFSKRRLHKIEAALLGGIIVFTATDGHTAGRRDVDRPASGEFGSGPRMSVGGQYAATLRLEEPLRPRKMRSIRVLIEDAAGSAVDGALITIDGGMPQHGHGLPTNPRVTGNPGGGIYEIGGVRFNMGGWWEFKLTINGPSGIDTVTFNLDL